MTKLWGNSVIAMATEKPSEIPKHATGRGQAKSLFVFPAQVEQANSLQRLCDWKRKAQTNKQANK